MKIKIEWLFLLLAALFLLASFLAMSAGGGVFACFVAALASYIPLRSPRAFLSRSGAGLLLLALALALANIYGGWAGPHRL